MTPPARRIIRPVMPRALLVELRITWPATPTRPWLGSAWFVNRFQDWQLRGGRAECLAHAPTQPMRVAHLPTAAVSATSGTLQIDFEVTPWVREARRRLPTTRARLPGCGWASAAMRGLPRDRDGAGLGAMPSRASCPRELPAAVDGDDHASLGRGSMVRERESCGRAAHDRDDSGKGSASLIGDLGAPRRHPSAPPPSRLRFPVIDVFLATRRACRPTIRRSLGRSGVSRP